MHSWHIAVEEDLANISDYLDRQGCRVSRFRSTGGQIPNAVDAVVISGTDTDVLNVQDVEARVPVIDARGMTPQGVARRLAERLREIGRS